MTASTRRTKRETKIEYQPNHYQSIHGYYNTWHCSSMVHTYWCHLFKPHKPDGKIKLYYRGTARSFGDLASTSSLLELYPHTPEWIMEEYKNGRFMAPIMSLVTCHTTKRWRHTIVVEDFSQQSAWNITEIAKKFIIGALLGDQANKHHIMATAVKTSDKPSSRHRHRIQSDSSATRVAKLSLVDTEVILSPKHTTILPVPLNDVPQVPDAARKEILYRVFHYTEAAESDIPEGLQLAMIAGRCWVRNVAGDNTHLIQSLVCCILTCYGHFPMIDRIDGCKLVQHDMLFFLHSYAQWQCLLHHVIAFNQVLGHPFPYTSPARLFSSSLLLHFYQQTSQVLQEKMDTLATSMLQMITESEHSTGLLEDIELEPPQTKKRRTTCWTIMNIIIPYKVTGIIQFCTFTNFQIFTVLLTFANTVNVNGDYRVTGNHNNHWNFDWIEIDHRL